MLKVLERNIASFDDRILLVAPSADAASTFFKNIDVDTQRHAELVDEVQRVRGEIYLQDGAIGRDELSTDGRHVTAEDAKGWHMLLLDKEQRVGACALYLEHDPGVTLDQLRVRHCPLAQLDDWRNKLTDAVSTRLNRARQERLKLVELGGWAVKEAHRGCSGPLTLALAVYGFSRRAGGALGMTTATVRHCSSTILKRLGGAPLEMSDGSPLPPYYDPKYKCMMELLGFDSRRPNPRYITLIDQLRERLSNVMVVARPGLAMDDDLETRGIDRSHGAFVPRAVSSRLTALAS